MDEEDGQITIISLLERALELAEKRDNELERLKTLERCVRRLMPDAWRWPDVQIVSNLANLGDIARALQDLDLLRSVQKDV